MSCRSVRDWLHRDVDSLDEAQRLVLDDHLAACRSCREDRGQLRLVQRIGASLPVPPAGARMYSRAIARALLEDDARTTARLVPARWPRFAVAALAVAALAITVAIVRGGAGDSEPAKDPVAVAMPSPPPASLPPAEPAPDPTTAEPAPDPTTAEPAPDPTAPAERAAPAPVSTDIVEEGALADHATTIGRGEAIPADTSLRASVRTRLRLASCRVVIAASSEIRWSPEQRTVALARGTLEIDSRGAGVSRVLTERFEVELEDGSVTVEPAMVRVRRGAAKVSDRGRTPLARLVSGQTWRFAASDAATPSAHQPNATPVAPSATELLAQARAQFAERDLAAAERTANHALASVPTRGEQAEARILLADVAQAAGALETAAARYGSVATAFADTPAAESALYAAARIELRRARAAAARVLLERYLERYPAGRYADDVRRDLASLH